jgi:hypothetical protein
MGQGLHQFLERWHDLAARDENQVETGRHLRARQAERFPKESSQAVALGRWAEFPRNG